MNRTPEAVRLSTELARELGQLPAPNASRTVRVPSRKTAGVFYDVVIGLDGALLCNCPASFNHLQCWHLKFVREEIEMTTETSTALVPIVVQPSVALLPTERDLDLIDRAAAMVWAGAVALPEALNSVQKVAAVMLFGLELGLKPMTAIQHLYIVKGKVSASAQVMAGLCMSKEKDIAFHVEQLDASICTMRMLRPSRNVDALYTVTWEQIKRAKLDSNPMNQAYPEDRLTYHCMKRLCRAYAPDLINNLDDGVALPALTEPSQWREQPIDSAEFYNDGDAPQPGLAQDNPEFDDEGAADVPTATDEQLAAIADWSDQIKQSDEGSARLKVVDATRRERWAYAVDTAANRFMAAKLTQEHADAYISLLRETHEGKTEAPVQQPALTP